MSSYDLNGWDEIAKHLGDVNKRTVQRWEREAGLPVSRFRKRVHADKKELDHWLLQQSSQSSAVADDLPTDFRRVFGNDSYFYLIYSELTLNPAVPKLIDAYQDVVQNKRGASGAVRSRRLREILKRKPLVTYDPKGQHGKDGYNFRAEHSACVCEVRAAAYIAAEFSRYKSLNWKVVGNGHQEIYGKSDLSFVSFGTLINSKSRALMKDPQSLIDFKKGRFVSRRAQLTNSRSKALRFLHEPVHDSSRYDYGVIAKIHPSDSTVDEGRTWIACAGVQQKGTSAAAWVLAHWREVAARLRQNTGRFVGLVRVPKADDKGDDHGKLLWLIEKPEELKRHELKR